MPEKEKSSANQGNLRNDDYRKIKGIGATTARVLHELGLHTYQDLANMTPARLEELLKGKVSTLTLRRIAKDDWPGQARAMIDWEAGRSPSEGPFGATAGKTAAQPHRETWRELADFFISFGYAVDAQGNEYLQTKAHQSQADKQVSWEGIPIDALIEWMSAQAGLPLDQQAGPPAAAAQDSGPQAGVETFTRLTMSDVVVTEVTAPSDPAEGQQGDKRLRIETQLTLLDDVVLNQSSGRAPYSIEVYLVDVQTNQSKLANAFSSYLTPGHHRYPISQDINIPDTGRYQLIVVARLLPPLIGIAQSQGPLIRVEA